MIIRNQNPKGGTELQFNYLEEYVDKKLLDQVGIDKQYLKDKHHIDAVHNAFANQTPFGKQLKVSLVRVLNYGEKTGDRSGEPTCTAQDIIRTIDYVIDESLT